MLFNKVQISPYCVFVIANLSLSAGYDAARHTQIRTRDYEQYDYFSIYVDRGDDKMYEMRRVDNLHHEHGTNGRYAKIRKMRRPSENSIHADYASYRY